MPRPASFDQAQERKTKRRNKRGDEFQNEIRKGLKQLSGFTRRFADIVNVDKSGQRKNISAPSPPDYIHVGRKVQLLIECKAVQGKTDTDRLPTSVPFSTVAAHQVKDLLEFQAVGRRTHAFIAFNLYSSDRTVKRTWLIPVSEWTACMEELGAKASSVKLHWFTDAETWGSYEIPWLPGRLGACWDIKSFIEEVLL